MKNKLKTLIENNSLARDILEFFYLNQSSVDTGSGVAAWVHKGRVEVKEMLDTLVGLGVLEKDTMGGTDGYCYTRDENLMKKVEEMMKDE